MRMAWSWFPRVGGLPLPPLNPPGVHDPGGFRVFLFRNCQWPPGGVNSLLARPASLIFSSRCRNVEPWVVTMSTQPLPVLAATWATQWLTMLMSNFMLLLPTVLVQQRPTMASNNSRVARASASPIFSGLLVAICWYSFMRCWVVSICSRFICATCCDQGWCSAGVLLKWAGAGWLGAPPVKLDANT